ncbi:hypothetical protein TNIN_176641 [Trichonephila inaurata madagascariensis]|uniref:Uncharacterized protein n=1 Tax=Trichonephila inaurata madagascariensis TaxID=2747483 RepID=A0A8X7C678_9ARAC|nr:hypothetical protein TNIN_176641 [Trichonephila inaurata madagascariensis]
MLQTADKLQARVSEFATVIEWTAARGRKISVEFEGRSTYYKDECGKLSTFSCQLRKFAVTEMCAFEKHFRIFSFSKPNQLLNIIKHQFDYRYIEDVK